MSNFNRCQMIRYNFFSSSYGNAASPIFRIFVICIVVVVNAVLVSFLLDGLWSFCQTLDLETFCGLEEGRKLVLGHVHLAGVHEFQDGGQVLELTSRLNFKWFIRKTDERFFPRMVLDTVNV